MLISTSIFTGLLRLALLWLCLFYCCKRSAQHTNDLDIVNFIVEKWFKYGSVIVLIAFVLVLFNCYNLYNTLVILLVYILFDTYNFRGVKYIYNQMSQKVKTSVLFLLKHIELKQSLMFWISIKSKNNHKIIALKSIIIITVISSVIFLFRGHLFSYDKYILSELWIEDLNKVLSYNNHSVFQNLEIVEGEYLLTNFYSKLVHVSPEIALETFGVLQPICLGVILIWILQKLRKVGFILPLIGSICFGVLLAIMPLNINYITQHQSIFLALTITLPLLVYISKPKLIAKSNFTYAIYVFIALLAIGLINVFVLLIIIPPFLVINLLQPSLAYLQARILTIGMFITALIVLLAIYFQIDATFNLIHFLKVNLIAVSSFTYVPHLIVPYDTILNYVCVLCVCNMLISATRYIINRKVNKTEILFLMYYISLIGLYKLELFVIDYDLLYTALAVITPLIIGVNFVVLIKLISKIINEKYRSNLINYTSALVLCVISILFVKTNEIIEFQTTKTSQKPKDILQTYNKIYNNYMPYTYAVVNQSNTQALSIQKHYFISYNEFNRTYLTRDSIYQFYKKKQKILKKHPEYILPQSVLFFKHKNSFAEHKVTAESDNLLQQLRNRGRNITTIYESEHLEVLEIINTPKSSRVVDLIFKKR